MQTNSSSNQVKPDEFRVGDTVWCLIYGKGKVAFISESSDGYDVGVNFDNSGISAYTEDGRYSPSSNRTLFFSEPKVEASVTRPFVPTLVGKRVVVRQKACDDVMTTITYEDCGTFGDEFYTFDKCLVEVYEVSSENLLNL